MSVLRYRKKPVVIEAMHVTDPASALAASIWMKASGWNDFEILDNRGSMRIGTLEGDKEKGVPFVLIRGLVGEFYPCRASIFEQTYESVD